MFRHSLRAFATPAYRTLHSSTSTLTSSLKSKTRLSPLLREYRLSACSSRRFATSVPWRSETDQARIDAAMEEITELYATARDEFEIAAEETEKATVYAEDDRKAAREELTKLQDYYKKVTQDGQDSFLAEEVKRRVGPRIRELENAVVAMEEMASNHD